MSDREDRPEASQHLLGICQSFTGRQWVECSCGWESPELGFYLGFGTDAEAIAWARKEHGIDE